MICKVHENELVFFSNSGRILKHENNFDQSNIKDAKPDLS